jgi:hypothetical protein
MAFMQERENSKPEFVRLPSPRGRCPLTGLSRTSLCELTVPSPVNDNRPPVKSVVIRKRGATRGIRLISYDSLMAYLNGLGSEAKEKAAA